MSEAPPEPQPLDRILNDVFLGTDATFLSLAPQARALEFMRQVLVRTCSYRPRLSLEAPGRISGGGYRAVSLA
jgi:hypothetical protein